VNHKKVTSYSLNPLSIPYPSPDYPEIPLWFMTFLIVIVRKLTFPEKMSEALFQEFIIIKPYKSLKPITLLYFTQNRHFQHIIPECIE